MAVSAEVSNANDSSSSLYLLRDVSLISSWVLVDIKRDLIKSNIECGQRGLKQSAKWAAELLYALDQVATTDMPPETFSITVTPEFLADYDRYVMAKSYLDLEEYDRAAHFTKTCKSPLAYFIHVYARYLAGEKRKVDDAVETTGPQESSVNDHLKTLRFELQKKYKAGTLDGYCLYLYGVILKKLDLTNEAINILVEAVHAEPLHWGAWLELSQIITDRDMLNNLLLGDCWIRYFFVAQAYFEIQLNEDSLQIYETLSQRHFSRSTYLMAQTAMAFHNMRDVDRAIATFNQLQQVDPYRLDNMDTFSNLLYVKEMKAELAYLAHHCCEIDKYRVETCCVLGNYYSLRSQHEKAVLYFQRALKISPAYLCAWTLMGHEYMELKNTSAAIQAYRQAVEVNKRDYRAWYGLGQTYEILKMPFYCLYYYRQAQMLRPNDSRMVVALGEAYDNLGRLQEAKRCYWKARSLGDVEGLALIKLARLYEKLAENDQAAAAYTQYLNETSYSGMMPAAEDQAQAYKFIANYHLTARHLEEAYSAATRCTDFRETREEGKALLRQISQLRILESAPSLKGLPFEQRVARDDMDLGQSTTDSQSTPQFSMTPRTFSS